MQASTKLWQLCPEDMDLARAMHEQISCATVQNSLHDAKYSEILLSRFSELASR